MSSLNRAEVAPTAVPSPRLRLAESFGHLVRRSLQVHALVWGEVFEGELTSPQYAVLTVIAVYPGIDQRRLGELASLDKSSTADVVARLAGKRWLVRRRDEADARRDVLELTPAAAIALQHLTPSAQSVQDELIRPLPVSRRAAFLSNLSAVARVEDGVSPPVKGSTPPVLGLGVLGHLLRRAQQVQKLVWVETFGRELTGPQFATMYVLSQWPGINQRELGDRAALDKSTVADVIDRLVRRGWVTRVRDPSDGRGRILHLTPHAIAVTEDLTPRVAAMRPTLLRALPSASHDGFIADLGRVAFRGEIPPDAP